MTATTRGRLIRLIGLAMVSLAGSAAAQESAPAPTDSVRPLPDSAKAARPPRRRSDTIYRDQIQNQSFATAFDVVESLKNNWMVRRPSMTVSRSPSASADTSSIPRSGGGTSTTVSGNPNATMQAPMSTPDRSLPGMDGGIQVYLDGARMGGVEQLRNIPAGMIYYIRRFDPIDAQARLGIGHTAGAIVVSTRPEQP